MAISATDVRDLREKTGAPMMDCKKALEMTQGDFNAAEDQLRKMGLKAAGKKEGRSTGEGRCQLLLSECGTKGALVALACETDFVAATPDFEAYITGLCEHILAQGPEDAAEMMGQDWSAGGSVADSLTAIIGKLGENMSIAGAKLVVADGGFVGGYIHHNQKVGVLSAIRTEASREECAAVLKQLGMHAAAVQPTALGREEIDPELVQREVAIYREEVKDKPAEIQDKIIAGKLNKFYAGICLREQAWVMDDSKSVEKAVADALGKDSIITDYGRFSIG